MATWPATLPDFSLELSEARQQGFIRTPMDTGPAKARRRFSAVARALTGEITLTAAQRTTFDTFYATTISEGADTFDFTDPLSGTTATARFVAPPQFTHKFGAGAGTVTQFYRAALRIEILP